MNATKSFRSLTGLLTLSLFGLLSTTSCQSNSNTVDPSAPSGGKKGYVTGNVTDPQGKPLAQATIYTENTVVKDRGAEVKTSSGGSYQIQLIDKLGQWIARGFILKQYNGHVYKISLDPKNADSFTAEEQPVRDFQWKLTGHVPDLSLDLYYGGTVELFRDPNTDLYDNENIEFTFKPVGPLIDGSTGQTLTLRAKKRYDNFLKDLPIGRYEVSAVYKPTNTKLKVSDVFGDGDYASSVTVDFTGRESATRENMMGIGYTR